MQIASYDTDLTDGQWDLHEPLLPAPIRLGRPRTPARVLCNAILYLVTSGCPWRLLPKRLPPRQTVYDRFRKWCRDGTRLLLNEALRAVVRTGDGRSVEPSAAALDRQTVRSDGPGGSVGYDAGKNTRGRKRFILVDALGPFLGVDVAAADTPERAGARSLLQPVLPRFDGLRKMWVDGGYTGTDVSEWVAQHAPQLEVEVIKRSDQARGFHVLPKRWVVERTFGWLMKHRRLVRDHEKTGSSAIGWVVIAFIRIMLGRPTQSSVD